jgi:TIR domain
VREHALVHVFLSHNRADKDVARRLGAQMRLSGADVWFDEWAIRAGDSIPGKMNEALAVVDTVVLLRSSDANRSEWVRAEFETAITRGMEDKSLRVVPVILDGTPLPPMVRRLRRVDLRDGDETRAVNEIMGFASDQDRLRAIQQHLDEAGIEVAYYEGYGPVVCCPHCGAGLDKLRGWSDVDEKRDDMYAGFECTECGRIEGSEI